MTFSIIVCTDKSFGIGFNNRLLTHLPNDLKRFKQLTKNKICIMGRKTYESIIEMNGKPLEDRVSIVLTENKCYEPPLMNESVLVYHDIDKLVQNLKTLNRINKKLLNFEAEFMICGGSNVYQQMFQYADKIYLTLIHHKFDYVDSYFPRFSLKHWNVDSNEFYSADSKHQYDYSFKTFSRKM